MALSRGGLMVKLSLEKQREKLNEDVQSLNSVLNEDDALIFKDGMRVLLLWMYNYYKIIISFPAEKSLQMLLHNKGREACNSRSINPNLEISPSVEIVPTLAEKGNNVQPDLSAQRSHLV